MPRITTHALDLETVKRASLSISADIARLLEIPPEYVTIQVSSDPFIRGGQVVPGDPFVEIALFDRGSEKEDEVARIVTRRLQEAGCPALDVYLAPLEKRRYFENGEHF